MQKVLRIGTRESQLAVWQANRVKDLLAQNGFASELVFIKSEGDIDLQTPLYEIGVQGIFTRSLDIALLNSRIDLAVHSMKDVPTKLPKGLLQAAVLQRANYKDLLVFKNPAIVQEWKLHSKEALQQKVSNGLIATSSIRRKAQWLHRYPNHSIENLRGNVNTRLQKLKDSSWDGAIFAAAGLERINLRPANSIELDWMLPAPAQGAIVIICRETDRLTQDACRQLNHLPTEICTRIEKDFLKTLLGGCSTPISALAEITGNSVLFKGNIFTVDGSERVDVQKLISITEAETAGESAAYEVLAKGGQMIADSIHHER